MAERRRGGTWLPGDKAARRQAGRRVGGQTGGQARGQADGRTDGQTDCVILKRGYGDDGASPTAKCAS